MPTYAQDSDAFRSLCKKDPILAEALYLVGPLEYQIFEDGFHFLVTTIVSQMLSAKVADVLINRLLSLCKQKIRPEALKDIPFEQLRSIGLSTQKAMNILRISQFSSEHPTYFSDLSNKDNDEVFAQLTAHKGIGSWTAKMYLIFVLDRMDIIPYEDGAFLQSYRWLYQVESPQVAEILQRAKLWSPYESLAGRYLYRLLDLGFTKKPRHHA